MNTAKPISTISYNSKSFLISKLDELIKAKIIEFYMFIEHIGEDDPNTDLPEKDHIHLYVVPNRKINTMDFNDLFSEPVPGSVKPLGCIRWVSSQSDDFILYTLHDSDYLLSKFEVREYAYTYYDFHVSNDDDFDRLYKQAFNSSGYAKNKNFYAYIKAGGCVPDLVKAGAVNPNQVEYYENFEKMCKKVVDK